MREVKLHVETLDRFIGETMAMAERLDGGERERQTAHIAFESMETFLKVLTPNRWARLIAVSSRGPSSIRALAQTLGRDYRGGARPLRIGLDLDGNWRARSTKAALAR